MPRPLTDENLIELSRERARRLAGENAPRASRSGALHASPSGDWEHPRNCPYLDELLRRYESRVLRWCFQILRHREDAADCAQETLLRICERIDEFRGDSSFGTWVYVITRRACFEARRAQQTSTRHVETWAEEPRSLADVSAETRPLASLTERESRVLFQAMFRRHITADESRVMILHHVDGHPMKTVTEMLDLVNPSGARAFLANAKRKLRNHLSVSRLEDLGFSIGSRFRRSNPHLGEGEGLEHGG